MGSLSLIWYAVGTLVAFALKNKAWARDDMEYSAALVSSMCALHKEFEHTELVSTHNFSQTVKNKAIMKNTNVFFIRDCKSGKCTGWYFEYAHAHGRAAKVNSTTTVTHLKDGSTAKITRQKVGVQGSASPQGAHSGNGAHGGNGGHGGNGEHGGNGAHGGNDRKEERAGRRAMQKGRSAKAPDPKKGRSAGLASSTGGGSAGQSGGRGGGGAGSGSGSVPKGRSITTSVEGWLPWDVTLKFIWDWGPTSGDPGKFPRKEKEANNIKGIKELHRCTGTFYSKSYLLTTAWCGYRGTEFALTRNRFVAWLARKSWLLNEWCMYKSDVNAQQSCDVTLHPDFKPFADEKNSTTNKLVQDRLNDVSLIKMNKPFEFNKKVHAIEFAHKDMEFEGEATFTGWGSTNDKPKYPSKMHTVKMKIIPFSPECEKLIKKYLYKGAMTMEEGLENMFMCTKVEGKGGLCGGDVGGGLICQKDGKKYLCGMRNSWGAVEQCEEDGDQHEIFLKISHYIDWIESVAGKQDPADFS